MARILLIEDEAPLLSLLGRYLKRSGYDVEPCSTAEEAWTAFEADTEGFTAVVADQTLPDGDGEGLVRRMLERNPGLYVVVSTGYPFDLATLNLKDPTRGAFLQKPFLPKALGEALERMLPGE